MAHETFAIELKGITKTFGTVVANDAIDLCVKRGEILALLGENGSGKTTLMNMLSGIYKPDSGEIFVDGKPVSINSPEDSKALRIGMVHQHFKLVERFSAGDNIWISAGDEKEQLLSESRYTKIAEFSQKYGFDIDPAKPICDMSVSEKQTVEILKVLYNGADILILDEPTAVLTLQETRRLFTILRRMRDNGCAIIIITHKLNEVLELSDRVTILRKGRSVATVETAQTNAKELTELMVGHAVDLQIDRPKVKIGKTLLKLDGLTVRNEEGVLALDDIHADIRRGEILGVAGVSGCGQKELCEAIAGLLPVEKGRVFYKGEDITGQSPRQIIEHGISMSFIPEDRLGMGLAASMGITGNMMLKNYHTNKGMFVNHKGAQEQADKIVEQLEISTPSTSTPVRRLSGGNVQKVLLGREMLANPNVIITAYPVRGLDINSSYTIYNILNEEKKKGTAILYVGEDLDVMLELCDRILVLCHGRVTGVVDASKATKEQLGLLMTDANSQQKLVDEEERTKAIQPDFTAHTDREEVSTAETDNEKKRFKLPQLQVSKRGDLTAGQTTVYYTLAVLAALVFGGLFIAINGVNPFSYFSTVVTGCFKNTIYLRGFIRIIIPLIITSLGIAASFKMKFWNIGGNGQFIVGAVAAATVGFACNDALPRWLTLLLMAVAGALGGALFGLIPALCKVKFGTSETLLTLMFNYIAFYVLTYLKNLMFFRKLSDTGEVYRPDFKQLPQSAWLYEIKLGSLNIDISLIVALLLVVLFYVYFKHSKQGYEVSVVGDSQNTARYAGMNVKGIILRTMFISSAIVGLGGMLQVSGSATSHMLGDGITGDVGWTAVIVAWLAKLNPFAILIVSLLMGILQKGSAVAESAYQISSAASDILEGIILFSVLAADFFINYRIVVKKKGGKN